jgi:Uncharacterized protein conserved in bacteria
MQVNELIKRMQVDKIAPFHCDENLRLRGLTEFRCITIEEYNDYINRRYCKHKYNEDELGIYILNLSVSDFYNSDYNSDKYKRYGIVKTLKNINRITSTMYYKDELVYTTFVILHEVGHWVHFKGSGMKSLDYYLWDINNRNKYINYIGKNRNSDPAEIFSMYRKIPSEKAADEYALENIKDVLEKIRIYK